MERGEAPRFVADSMLGRLARWLRAMGYDTLYLGRARDGDLLELANRERRTLLTRDLRLARTAGKDTAYQVRAERIEAQLAEVVAAFGLDPETDPLSRCLECNHLLAPLEAGDLRGRVPPHILASHRKFSGCAVCGRVYWEGSHAQRMRNRLRAITPGATS
ncbi:MAG: Mut7-C RNAse domain-containing protein [Candidatus Rokubacteria bacterium]|nr:Mut7-C RNAse domain-containing protein [Candidatus Rokubacteria bacterium]